MDINTIYGLYKSLEDYKLQLEECNAIHAKDSLIINNNKNKEFIALDTALENEKTRILSIAETEKRTQVGKFYDSYEYKSRKKERDELEKQLNSPTSQFDKNKKTAEVKKDFANKNKTVYDDYFNEQKKIDLLKCSDDEKFVLHNKNQSACNKDLYKLEQDQKELLYLIENGLLRTDIKEKIKKIDDDLLKLESEFKLSIEQSFNEHKNIALKQSVEKYEQQKQSLLAKYNAEIASADITYKLKADNLTNLIRNGHDAIAEQTASETIVNHKLPLLRADDKIWTDLKLPTGNYTVPLSFIKINTLTGENPLIIDFFNKKHIVVTYNNSTKVAAYDFIKLLTLKALLSLEPGNLSIFLQDNNEFGNLRNLNESILKTGNGFLQSLSSDFQQRNRLLNPDEKVRNWEECNLVYKIFKPFVLISLLEYNKYQFENTVFMALANGIELGVNCIIGVNTDNEKKADDEKSILDIVNRNSKVNTINIADIIQAGNKIENYSSYKHLQIVQEFNAYVNSENLVSGKFSQHYKADELLNNWESSKLNAGNDISLLIGLDEHKEKIFFSIDITGGIVHNAIGGASGSGKSVFTTSVVLGLLYQFSYEVLELHLLDFKEGITFSSLKEYPHVKNFIYNPDEEFVLSYLKEIKKIAQDRNAYLKDNDCVDISVYNNKFKEKQFKRIVIVIDEAQEIFNDQNEDEINAILTVCRSAGINFIFTYNNQTVRSLPIKNIIHEYALSIDDNKEKTKICTINNIKFYPLDSRDQGAIYLNMIKKDSYKHNPFIYNGNSDFYLSDDIELGLQSDSIVLGREFSFIKHVVTISLSSEIKQNILILGDNTAKYKILETIIKSLLYNNADGSIMLKIIDSSKRSGSDMSKMIPGDIGIIQDETEIEKLIEHVYSKVKSRQKFEHKLFIIVENRLDEKSQDRLEEILTVCPNYNVHIIAFSYFLSSFSKDSFNHKIYTDQNSVNHGDISTRMRLKENSALYLDNSNTIQKKFKIYHNNIEFNSKSLLPLIVPEQIQVSVKENSIIYESSKKKSKSKIKKLEDDIGDSNLIKFCS